MDRRPCNIAQNSKYDNNNGAGGENDAWEDEKN
jgi:hypothetical protein